MSELELPKTSRRTWWRRLLLGPVAVLVVVVLVLVLVLGWVIGSQSGLRTVLNLSEPFIPEGIQIGEVTGRLLGPLFVTDLQLELDAVAGSVAAIELHWQPSQLFSGALHIDKFAVDGVSLTLLKTPEPEEPPEAFELPQSLKAPMDVFLKQMSVSEVVVRTGETVVDISSLEAAASWIDTRLKVDRLQVDAPLFNASADAEVNAQQDYPLELDLKLSARLPDYEELRANLKATGTAHDPQLKLSVESPYNTEVAASIGSVFAVPTIDATLDAYPARLTAISKALPDLTPRLRLQALGVLDDLGVDADLSVKGDGIPASDTELRARLVSSGVELTTLEVSIEEQPQPLRLSGSMGFEGEQAIDISARWPEVRLPGAESDQELRLLDGKLTVGGTLSAYRFDGETQVRYLGQKNPVTLRGTGNQTSVQLDGLRAGMGQGELLLKAAADWASGVKAQASLVGKRVNPGIYVSQFPGAVDLDMQIEATQTAAGDWSARLGGLKIDGDLIDLPLSASGSARFARETLNTDELKITLGDNEVALNGQLGEVSNFDWSMDLGKLSQFSAIAGLALEGTLTGQGQVSGKIEDVQLSANLEGRDLKFDQQTVERVELVLDGARRGHNYSLLVDSPLCDLSLKGSGDLDLKNSWSYELDELLLGHPDLEPSGPAHEWTLENKAVGQIAADRIEVKTLCLRHLQPSEGGAVCLTASQEGNSQSGGDLSAGVSLDALKLANLNALLPHSMRLEGELAGDLNWAGAVEKSSADLQINGFSMMLRGTAQEEDEEEKKIGRWLDTLKFAPSVIEIKPVANQLTLLARLPLDDGTDNTGVFVNATVVPKTSQPTTQWPIDSKITLELPDLSWVAAFSDQLESFNGALSGGLIIEGNAESPRLSGVTVLSVPQTDITELGLELRDTRIELKGTNDGLELSGALRSGKGELDLIGTVSWQDGLKIDSRVTGENFMVSDSPLARAAISPDLRASFADNKLKLRGDVVVPLAEIKLNKIPDGAVSASSDQRFIEDEQTETPLDMDAKIRVVLGDNVRFEGLGLKASFGGDLTVTEKSTGTTTGKGEILIKEGTYKAYGQDLSVENGKVIFAGGPIESPGLDVRAVRQATPDVSVGVHVQGSVADPTLTVFSTPSLPQSDQLSYLVLGRPLSSSSVSENSVLQQAAMAIGVQGGTLITDKIGKSLGVDNIGIESEGGAGTAQAALVVGKYLSPRLYVSYGYGLFEPISTLKMEYQFARLWKVVTESTNRATGGDLRYVLER